MTLGPMRILTQRAIRLKDILEGLGKEVYEVFPGAFYDVMGVSRKDRKAIGKFYLNMGLDLEKRKYTQDELDGIACLLTGCMFLEGKGVLLKGGDGAIVIPKHP
jgi:predicted nuclease with RNAse H fold